MRPSLKNENLEARQPATTIGAKGDNSNNSLYEEDNPIRIDDDQPSGALVFVIWPRTALPELVPSKWQVADSADS